MSILQRITRSLNVTSRSFSTARIALAESTTTTTATPAKPTGLYQFFENNEALPKQIWTGKRRPCIIICQFSN